MLDRSPDDELGSGDEDETDSEMDDANETTHDGERTIYPWMKKIHVAGVGEYSIEMIPFVQSERTVEGGGGDKSEEGRRFFNPLS